MNHERTPLVAGNWKMNTTVSQGLALAREIVERCRPAGVDVMLLPPFPHLWPMRDVLAGTGVLLGAQDAFWDDAGAYTGEVSPAMLAECCDAVLIGHSERRHLLGETDEQVARKVVRALDHPLTVIVAVGETLPQREAGAAVEVVHRQLDTAFASVDRSTLDRCVVAYEPVWAIGTGRTATPAQAQEMCRAIRERLGVRYSSADAALVRVLYGGSVASDNAAALFSEPDIDGGLVGGASLRAGDFAVIVDAAVASAAS